MSVHIEFEVVDRYALTAFTEQSRAYKTDHKQQPKLLSNNSNGKVRNHIH